MRTFSLDLLYFSNACAKESATTPNEPFVTARVIHGLRSKLRA